MVVLVSIALFVVRLCRTVVVNTDCNSVRTNSSDLHHYVTSSSVGLTSIPKHWLLNIMEDACVVRCFNKILAQKRSLHIKWLIFGITSGVWNKIALMLRKPVVQNILRFKVPVFIIYFVGCGLAIKRHSLLLRL